MSLTMPQIILLNHAAWVNSEHMKQRMDTKTEARQDDPDNPVVYQGKRLGELNSDELARYYQQGV